MPEKKTLSVEETDAAKTPKQKRAGMRKSSSLRRSSEQDDSSSGDEGDKVSMEVCIHRLTLVFSRVVPLLKINT